MLWIIRKGEVKSDEHETALEAVFRFRNGDAASKWFDWTPELLGRAMVAPGIQRSDNGRRSWYTVVYEMPAVEMTAATRPFDLYLHDDRTGGDVVKRFTLAPGQEEPAVTEHGAAG
ncbi:hypothetical protein [Streptomyces cinnamoneus]|uniref:hypothetical protein n=1 Tax=Streptomyces cinnamoneus TaxID=53446 RepID=UPI0037A6C530